MEMAGHGDLLEYIKLRGAINEDKARSMFGQLVSAVRYLHQLDIVHRLVLFFIQYTTLIIRLLYLFRTVSALP